jgi:hypothetical protein
VTVCPGFLKVVGAAVTAVPDRVLSLHTSLPEAATIQGPWVSSYWLTGPGYVLPRGAPGQLLDFWARLPWGYARGCNEDNVAIAWAWSKQEPIWSTIPALVTHDVETRSSLGYDKHPLRSASVPWETWPHPDMLAALQRESYWRATHAPFVENPWAQSHNLEAMRRTLLLEHPCEMCWQRAAVAGQGGISLCGSCLGRTVAMVLAGARAV